MDKKVTVYAGWLVLIPMLFLSVFYLLAGNFLAGSVSASVLTALAVCIFAAFGGTRVLAGLIKPLRRAARVRRLRTSRVYVPLIIWTSLTCAFGAVLINLLVSVFSGVRFFGLTGFYPILRESMAKNPILTFFLFAAAPAFLEEALLRGPVYSMCEKEGTAAAVFFGAVVMPLFYVYPQAYMPALLIGAVCSLMAAATDSLIAAIAVHLACRTALWAGDLLASDAGFLSHAGIYICILIFLFFLCLYRTLRTYAGLVRDELLTAPVRGAPQATENLKRLFFTPGFLLFFAVFLVRFVDMMIRYL